MDWQTSYRQWQQFEHLEPSLKEELDALSEAEAEEAFAQPIHFGTAGMRDVMGPGINRMNIYTVRLASEGLARLIAERGADAKERGVAIAYDGRYHSLEFALEAAKVLGNHDVKTFVFDGVRPTPELSFAVRDLGTTAGIMITASHNTKEYNGYKVYGADGGQLTPADADRLTALVADVDLLTIPTADLDALKANGLYQTIGTEVDARYLDQVATVTIDSDVIKNTADDLTIVYTPLQGTGQLLAEQAFARAGFKHVVYIPEQKDPDPAFSTLVSPNPEEASAFELAIAYGKQNDADVLIATDPDADRMGVGVRQPDGDYTILTGNQIAALLTDYILQAKQAADDLPANGVIVKSLVSGDLPSKIAAHYGIETIETLTGFKFIAEQIKEAEQTGDHTFLFGFEESYGFLIKAFVRDKDAIQTAVLFAELAAHYKQQGETPYDGLQALFEQYGRHVEQTLSVKRSGQAGAAEIAQIMNDLRANPPQTIADNAVIAVEDYQTQTRRYRDGHTEPLTIEAANVLKFLLADGDWLAVRPSGTEPKIKFYLSAHDTERADAKTKADAYHAFVDSIAK